MMVFALGLPALDRNSREDVGVRGQGVAVGFVEVGHAASEIKWEEGRNPFMRSGIVEDMTGPPPCWLAVLRATAWH